MAQEIMEQILSLQEQQQLLPQVVVQVEEFIAIQQKLELQVVLAEVPEVMDLPLAEQAIHLQ
jgi:hypothetical protein